MSMPALLDQQILEELTRSRNDMQMSGKLPSAGQMNSQLQHFAELFPPARLAGTDGADLLQLMHSRGDRTARSLVHWLEFKDDAEFYGNEWFGGIGGGSALKFGLFQHQKTDSWMTGAPNSMKAIPQPAAIDLARRQRDELVAGCSVLAEFGYRFPDDDLYAQIQISMELAAPSLHRDGWAHKYWSLIYPGMLDHYHSARYQRYHLYKMLQVPPGGDAILVDRKSPRFICAGRFMRIANELELAPSALPLVLNNRDGAYRRYWKVGTTAGTDGDSNFAEMLYGGWVSIGWKGTVPDLGGGIIQADEPSAKRVLRDMLHSASTNPSVVSRKAGEIYNFAKSIVEGDLVLACEGQTVLGVGRVVGPYEYDEELQFPHLRRVEWIDTGHWRLPATEGHLTTVFELGSQRDNLIELEQRLALGRSKPKPRPVPKPVLLPVRETARTSPEQALPPLQKTTARIEAILKRKRQVILYGPPGTGKTMHARDAARELAARHNLKRAFNNLDSDRQRECEEKYVRMCTFHPGWGYEDFIEGLRPQVKDGAMVFTPKDGVFKNLCIEAAADKEASYFLIIDEINRGDLPRIFGELITTIESSKRDTPVTLPVTGTRFAVPKNVFLIGTMNTADRSVSLMDTALRRRFGFIELMPDSAVFGKVDVGGLRLGAWLNALNERLCARLKRDARNMQIGHAYLLPVPSSLSQFAAIVRDDIIPLLEEYCYDDYDMLAAILGKNIVDVENACIREHLFAAEHERDLVQALQFEEMQEDVLDQEPTLDPDTDALDSNGSNNAADK